MKRKMCEIKTTESTGLVLRKAMMSTQLLSLTDTVSMTMLDSNRITSKTRFFSDRNHLKNIKIERFFTSVLL